MTVILRRTLFIMLLGLLFLLAQSCFRYFSVPMGFAAPNLMLILVVYIGFHEVSALGAVLAFLLGLQFDLASENLIGPWAGTFVFIFGILASMSQRIFVESAMSAFLSMICASIVSNLLYLVMTYHSEFNRSRGVWDLLMEALITGLAAPLVFKLLKILPLFRSTRSSSGRYSRRKSAIYSR